MMEGGYPPNDPLKESIGRLTRYIWFIPLKDITGFPKALMIILVEIQIVIITPRHFPDDSIPSP